MKRRQILTAAGALAGVALTGCGGGSETAGGDIGSEIAGYTTPPPTLVPQDGHYQIEVVFGLQRSAGVILTSAGNYIPDPVTGLVQAFASKSITTGWTHRVGFAKLRVTNEPQKNFEALGLVVTEQTKNADGTYNTWWHQCGRPMNASGTVWSTSVKYEYDAGNDAYIWDFFSADPSLSSTAKKLFCSVRMYRLPPTELYDPVSDHFDSTNLYFKVIPNNAPIGNLGTLATTRSQHLPTTLSYPNHESAVRKNANGAHNDTIVLQDPRQPTNFKMLVPTLHHATPTLRPMLERLLNRHVKRLMDYNASSLGDPINYEGHPDHHNLLQNELLRLLGGESLIQHMNALKVEIEAPAGPIFAGMGGAMGDYIRDNLQSYLTDDLQLEANRVLQQAINTQPIPSERAGGFIRSNQIALQFNMTAIGKLWPEPTVWAPGLAFRVSFPLWQRLRGNGTDENGQPAAELNSEYHIRQVGRDKFKFSVVGIAKLVNAGPLLAIDVEYTVNFSVLNGNVMVESMVLDPVIDVDGKDVLARMAKWGLKWLAKGRESGIGELIRQSPELTYAYENGLASMVNAGLQGGLAPLGALAPGVGLAFPVKEVVDAGIDWYVDNVANDFPVDNFNVYEGSFARVKWLHPDLGVVPQTASTALWREAGPKLCGWTPGGKWIFGFGKKLGPFKYVKVVSIDPPQGIEYQLSGYVRLVNVYDISYVHGKTAFFTASGLAFN